MEDRIRVRFREANDDAMEKLGRDNRLGAVSQLITTLISYLSYYIVLVFSGWLVLRGDFSACVFFIAIGMIDQLSWPLISLANIIRQLHAVNPVCHSIAPSLRAAPETCTASSSDALRTHIRFREVSFSYDGLQPILDRFSLTVKKDEKHLLKGPSGCGKTTAVNLLLRYYDPCTGSVELDGVPIETFSGTYGLMTVVRQEATLFRDTLRNNLTLYQPIDDGRLREVLAQVGLSRLANALDEPVAEDGGNFSGGEKKRICLARALLRDTEVLLLDEPLANLDPETAQRIEDLLLSIRDRTMIVVSHQFTETKLARFDLVTDLH